MAKLNYLPKGGVSFPGQFLTALSRVHRDCWPEAGVPTFARGKWREVAGP